MASTVQRLSGRSLGPDPEQGVEGALPEEDQTERTTRKPPPPRSARAPAIGQPSLRWTLTREAQASPAARGRRPPGSLAHCDMVSAVPLSLAACRVPHLARSLPECSCEVSPRRFAWTRQRSAWPSPPPTPLPLPPAHPGSVLSSPGWDQSPPRPGLREDTSGPPPRPHRH